MGLVILLVFPFMLMAEILKKKKKTTPPPKYGGGFSTPSIIGL